MIVGILTTCHTQYTWDRNICIFLFNRTIIQVFVTYLTGALYVHPLWFYKHQHDNRFRSKLFVARQRWWFQWWFCFVPSVPGYLREEAEHKPVPWCNPTERNRMGLHLENEVYCAWQFVITPTIILNNPVYIYMCVCVCVCVWFWPNNVALTVGMEKTAQRGDPLCVLLTRVTKSRKFKYAVHVGGEVPAVI